MVGLSNPKKESKSNLDLEVSISNLPDSNYFTSFSRRYRGSSIHVTVPVNLVSRPSAPRSSCRRAG